MSQGSNFMRIGGTVDNVQAGILAPPPRLGRFLTFSLKTGAASRQSLQALRENADGNKVVVGVGYPLVLAVERHIDGLRTFPSYFGSGLVLPSTQAALWCWLRGGDRGELLHASRKIIGLLSASFDTETVTDGFQYDSGRDLTGYEDGTENPKGEKAIAAAIVQGRGAGLDGSSFAAIQQWIHDFARFESLSPQGQDDSVGRRKSDNEELLDAPPSAHVKRTAQESFDPESFILRRSMRGRWHSWRPGVCGFWQVLRRVPGPTKKEWSEPKMVSPTLISIYQAHQRQLFLVSAAQPRPFGSTRLGNPMRRTIEARAYFCFIALALPPSRLGLSMAPARATLVPRRADRNCEKALTGPDLW
jgi:putative iron-dependent peroxidase